MQKRKPLREIMPKKKPVSQKTDIAPSERPKLSKIEQKRLDNELLDAANDDNEDIMDIRRLIKAGARIDAEKKDEKEIQMAPGSGETQTLVLAATEHAKPAENRKKVFEARKTGDTALQRAAFKGRTLTCALLIKEYVKAGGDPKKLIRSEKTGDTALKWAANEGHTETCALLIQEYVNAGGDARKLIEAEKKGWTALHLAAFKGYLQTCKLIMEEYEKAGGDPKKLVSMEVKGGWTAIDWAQNRGYNETSHYLRSFIN
ncbi:MAG: ankyrin repeat domain-containing protein [Candidatus Micrarchaeota archaeon]|nr:ankyrin repeat domain-containing protein [Candidatus Micrarchaeota archaeon]